MWPFSKKKNAPSPAAAPAPMPSHVEATPAAVPMTTPEATPPPATTSGQAAALIARWDQAIAQATADFQAELDAAIAGSQAIIEAVTTDLQPLARPWQTIEARMHEVTESVSDLWDDISDEMSEVDDFTHEMMTVEGNKRDSANLEIELAKERAFGGVMAQASQRMLDHALSQDVGAAPCQNCGAQMDKVNPVAASLNVECGYCMAVNTVNPGDALRMFAHSGAMYLALERTRPTLEAVRRIEHTISAYRDAKDVPLPMLLEFEQLNEKYWHERLTVEASYVPEQQKYVASKLERHIADAEKMLRRHWQWREHKSARPNA